jgi:RHS repeat-associated protein
MTTTRYTVVNGSIVSENRGGVIRDYLPNPLGNTLALLDNTQTQTDQWSYFPFGESKRIKGTNPTAMLFVGAKSCRQDSTGTKSLMGRRVLDLQKARWMTQDPIGFRGGDWNLNGYVRNSPVTRTDRSGLFCMPGQGQPIISPPKIEAPPYDSRDFGRAKTRKDCNDHYGDKYCSCMCQCYLQLQAFNQQIANAYKACLRAHPTRQGSEYCWLLIEVEMGRWKTSRDEDCRKGCLAHHRAPGQSGSRDTGPCQWLD